MTFTCAVLVTTAPLYRLKQGLTPEQVHAASDLEDVAVACDAVILWEPSTPELIEHATAIYHRLPAQALASRIERYSAVFEPPTWYRYRLFPSDASKRCATVAITSW
ncbi:hypothetical protein ACFPN2_28175 [Steroidobacter flavus]|uniref:Uncharacterized protein n=1 Tax=Steroidobacter flavus TaxID=1842136 RepID=A0ABV8T1F3_9GAMM